MLSQHAMISRPESPRANGNPSALHHIQSHEQVYGLHDSQDYSSDAETQKHAHPSKLNGFPSNSYRSSFNPFPSNRQRNLPPNILRENNNGFYPPSGSSEVFNSQLTSPTQAHMAPFDTRASFDYANGQNGMLNGSHKASNYNLLDPYSQQQSSNLIQQHKSSNQPPSQSHVSNYGPQPAPYSNGLHISSQTPFGPHVASPNSGPLLNGNANIGLPPGINQANMLLTGTNGQQEDISTIFVVGFPDDMQEREFQNMFTFSPGFEAATLKIPNKEYTAYGQGASGGLRANGYGQYGSNDPYNLVTVNQGGVVVDSREGTMASWPSALGDDPNGHYTPGLGITPRKQIIGFAKFRSKEEALAAKEVLQGRRVDIEKGAVLKAEMAKKNLHTKRGVGPVPGSNSVIGLNSNGLMGISGSNPMGNAMPNSLMATNNLGGEGYLGGDVITSRERDLGALGPIGISTRLNQQQWRDDPRDEDEWRRERDLGTLGAMGMNGPRGPRERAEEEERERRRREMRLRGTNPAAFEAFHSVPPQSIQSRPNLNSVVSPPGPSSVVSPLEHPPQNGLTHHSHPSMQHDDVMLAGPWDNMRRTDALPIQPPSRSSASPPIRDVPEKNLPHQQVEKHLPESRSSSAAGSGSGGSPGDGHTTLDADMMNSMGGFSLNGNRGNTSPQLPSPASGGSSQSARNGIDQNPPINTLYVGNLPTSPPPAGLPPDILEDSLRELFQAQPGFRRLSFKQKSSGPMCFVEFEDVSHATRTLNDLYGNTLRGLVKGGGIRLSYSKNPLGVRTPTSATGPSSLQQQQQQHSFHSLNNASFVVQQGEEKMQFRRGPPHGGSSGGQYISHPPPRFFAATSPPIPMSTSLSGSSDVFHPRHAMNMYGTAPSVPPPSTTFSPFGSHSPIPDQDEPNQHNDHHAAFFISSRALTPPIHNIEAARAG